MCLLLAVVHLCHAQSPGRAGVLDTKLSGTERQKKLSQVLDSLQRNGEVRFFYKSQWIEGLVFSDSPAGKTVREALDELFQGTELSYVEIYPHSIVIVKDPTQLILRQQAIGSAKREQRVIQTRHYGSRDNPTRKKTVSIRGTVVDSKSGEPLAGASIRLSDSTVSTTTNAEGKFAFQVRPGDYVVTIGYVNYEEATIDLSAYDDGVMNLGLEEMPRVLEEVIIQDRAEREITSSRIGQAQVSVAEVKRAPTILGEADLVKRVQTLPGVTTVGEAAAGFNVRGGSVDQNLILYDGMPVYNSSHAFGFLSSFNSQAIRDVSFYRAGIPAEFGGRVSSVLDIRSKEGSYEEWGGNAGIGMITANAMVNGPLKRNKTSMLAAIRSTYSNWLIHSIRTSYADLKRSSLSFYDATLKLNHMVSPDTKLSFTGYMSKDGFRLFGDSTYQWFNRVASARIDHRMSSDLSFDITAGISAYSYKVLNDGANAFELSYDLKTTSVKAGFNYQTDRHRLSFGTHLQYFAFNPGAFEPVGESSVEEVRMEQQRSFENALYAHDIFALSERTSIEGGVRVPVFSSLYGERATYTGVEPRVGLRFVTGRNSSIKAGYNRMYQFLHLISNTAAVTPVDVWQPANKDFKPQLSHHASIGYFRNFKEKKYEFSAETFYKTTDNILDFRDGAKLILNDRLSEDLLQGTARAYGIETMAGIVSGKVTGNINYTYSRSFRTVKGETEGASVNRGKEYPSNFDQPHVLNLSWKYSFTRRYHLTGTFTYHTGRPISVPIRGYFYENMLISGFSGRNQFRIPDYHRLDLAFVIEGNHKRKKLGDGTWVISVYNVYARKNAYSVFYTTSYGLLKPHRLAIIGTALPSVTYNFTF
jgi:hypothetical protein